MKFNELYTIYMYIVIFFLKTDYKIKIKNDRI